MITDERVKEFLKHHSKPGKANVKKNQELMLGALIAIGDLYTRGFPGNDVLGEYMQIEKETITIITNTLGELTNIYE